MTGSRLGDETGTRGVRPGERDDGEMEPDKPGLHLHFPSSHSEQPRDKERRPQTGRELCGTPASRVYRVSPTIRGGQVPQLGGHSTFKRRLQGLHSTLLPVKMGSNKQRGATPYSTPELSRTAAVHGNVQPGLFCWGGKNEVCMYEMCSNSS